ncbi:MAG TPA: SDR family NAD(P)-dependent oxidoreductase [Mycobacteriales bacterium]|nr:SDR family NAD(P)-dependent oxidoreductase [Mycobacteriales bacterium]
MDYRDKVAVVTGASSGLGRRLALDLAAAGAHVVAVARREERLRELGLDHKVCDLADVPACVDLLKGVEAEHGRIDVLLNVAGMGGVVRQEMPSLAHTRAVLEVNFFAPYAAMVTVLPGMRARGSGVVANMSSDDARSPGPGAGDYCASKAALSAATESLAYEAATDGVRLHVIYPGWVPTEMGRYAVEHGGLVMPPRPARRTEEQVATLVLRRLGDERVEINCATLPLVAPIFRTVAPRTYHRMRARR